MRLQDEQRLKVNEDVLSRMLDGEAVLLDLISGTYFGLNEVGSVIWELIVAGHRVGEIRARLLKDYDVDEETMRRDLEELVGTLLARGLVEVVEPAGG